MSGEILERIMRRSKELGLSPRAASLASGLGDGAIRDLIRRPGSSPSMYTLQKLAMGLKTTPEWLAYGSDDVPPKAEQRPKRMPVPSDEVFVEATYGGLVEAGTFREVGEFNDLERAPDYVARDERFPKAAYFVFDVAGDSMNAANPPIIAGSRVIAVAFAHFGNRLTLQTGMTVVIERTKEDGALRERSIKQLEMDEHETRFCPRSSNSKHKPIVITKNHEPDHAEKVEIIGIVINVVNKVKLGL